MSLVEGAQPSLGIGREWMCGETGLTGLASRLGPRVSGGTILGSKGVLERLSQRGSRSPNSRDHVNLPPERAGRCPRQERRLRLVQSMSNHSQYLLRTSYTPTTALGTGNAAMK